MDYGYRKTQRMEIVEEFTSHALHLVCEQTSQKGVYWSYGPQTNQGSQFTARCAALEASCSAIFFVLPEPVPCATSLTDAVVRIAQRGR
jgi:hypothetical protein